ncbi:MAG: GNAT family N-acetyltransferase [Actinomycetota bacterium]
MADQGLHLARTRPSFRRGFASDWPDIWPIFHAVVAAGDTYPYLPDISESDARAAWLSNRATRRITYVAELEDTIVGTAYLRPNQVGLGNHVANAAWMIDPSESGRGIGRLFALHILEEAARLGYQAMQFNSVVATNERALRLWTSMGFEIVGTVPDAFRHATNGLTDIHIMYKRL